MFQVLRDMEQEGEVSIQRLADYDNKSIMKDYDFIQKIAQK